MAIAANTISAHDLFGTLGVFSILCFRDLYFLKALWMAIAANTTSNQLFFCAFWTLYFQKENNVCKHISLSIKHLFELRTFKGWKYLLFCENCIFWKLFEWRLLQTPNQPIFSLVLFRYSDFKEKESMYFPKYIFLTMNRFCYEYLHLIVACIF